MPQQQHDDNTERVALRRRVVEDDQWVELVKRLGGVAKCAFPEVRRITWRIVDLGALPSRTHAQEPLNS